MTTHVDSEATLARMTQVDLFPVPSLAETAVYQPSPELVRARLKRIMRQIGQAPAPGLPSAQLSLYGRVVEDITRWLPTAEATRWRADFAAALGADALPEAGAANVGDSGGA